MTMKSKPQSSALMLQSQIRQQVSQFGQGVLRSIKSLNNNYKTNDNLAPSLLKSQSQNRIRQVFIDSNISNKNQPNKSKMQRKQSLQSQKFSQIQASQLKEQKELLQRNYSHEVEYYVRERMKDLITIQEMLTANQIQRVQKYVQTELNHLRKIHQLCLGDETCCNPILTRDISLKSNIEEDANYNQLVSNLISNIKQLQIGNNFTIPIVKKLGSEGQLTIKKLTWYFQQLPFQITSHHVSKNLAIKLIGELGCSDGRKVVDIISKSMQQKSKGKYKLFLNQQEPKSEMSKLIEEHSNSRIKIGKVQ